MSYEFNPITNELVENGWSQRLDNLMELFSCEKIEKFEELLTRLSSLVFYPIQFLKSFIKVRSKYATSSILTDVSTLINSQKLLFHNDGNSLPLDGFSIFDLEVFVTTLILRDSVFVIHPIDLRYSELPDVSEFKRWEEESEIVSDLRKKQILRVSRWGVFVDYIWNEVRKDKQGRAFRTLKRFFRKSRDINRINFGFGKKLDMYSNYYRQLYAPDLVSQDEYEDALNLALYRTNLALEFSKFYGMPYFPHSAKLPLLIWKVNNRTDLFFARKAVDYLSKEISNKYSYNNLSIEIPPLLLMVLSKCEKPEDIYDTTLELRNESKVRRFRKWCAKLDIASRENNVNEIRKAWSKIENIVTEIKEEHGIVKKTIFSVWKALFFTVIVSLSLIHI